jgi:phosphoribosylformylglycinamidine synthase
MPFISGKDSLNNEYHSAGRNIVIPPTLLISALGLVPDVRRCVTMDLKEPGNFLFLVGVTKDEMGGSHYNLVRGLAVAVAEMAFAGGLGTDLTGPGTSAGLSDDVWWFSESATRFVIEVAPNQAEAFQQCLGDVPHTRLGQTVKEPRLRIAGANGEWVIWAQLAQLKEAWQKPLRW